MHILPAFRNISGKFSLNLHGSRPIFFITLSFSPVQVTIKTESMCGGKWHFIHSSHLPINTQHTEMFINDNCPLQKKTVLLLLHFSYFGVLKSTVWTSTACCNLSLSCVFSSHTNVQMSAPNHSVLCRHNALPRFSWLPKSAVNLTKEGVLLPCHMCRGR